MDLGRTTGVGGRCTISKVLWGRWILEWICVPQRTVAEGAESQRGRGRVMSAPPGWEEDGLGDFEDRMRVQRAGGRLSLFSFFFSLPSSSLSLSFSAARRARGGGRGRWTAGRAERAENFGLYTPPLMDVKSIQGRCHVQASLADRGCNSSEVCTDPITKSVVMGITESRPVQSVRQD